MHRKKNSAKPVDLSYLFMGLKMEIFQLKGAPLDFNTQQEIAQILQIVLDELKGVSLAASQLISSRKKSVLCITCFCSSASEKT